MKVRLIAITQQIVPEIANQEQLIEYAGRKCTNTCEKTGNNTQRFIQDRVKQGHTSILEHVSFTFEINGISRVCLAQLTRHRIASYSVQSQRYVKQTNQDVVIPDSIEKNPFAKIIFDNLIDYCFKAYEKLLSVGILKEDARFVLPMAICTDLIMTMNLRELLLFFSLRSDSAAQLEIRKLSDSIKEIVKQHCPSVF